MMFIVLKIFVIVIGIIGIFISLAAFLSKRYEYYSDIIKNKESENDHKYGMLFGIISSVTRLAFRSVSAASKSYGKMQSTHGNNNVQVQIDSKETIKRLHEESAQSETSSPFTVGNRYYEGTGVPQDYNKRIEWLQMAAEQNNVDAQFALGIIYYKGKGVPQDYIKAVKWLQLAADQSNADAQYFLGVMYYEGKGVPQDFNISIKWLQMAADQNNANAQYFLGIFYYEGKGITQDYNEAIKWLQMAAMNGNKLAQIDLAKLQNNDDIDNLDNNHIS